MVSFRRPKVNQEAAPGHSSRPLPGKSMVRLFMDANGRAIKDTIQSWCRRQSRTREISTSIYSQLLLMNRRLWWRNRVLIQIKLLLIWISQMRLRRSKVSVRLRWALKTGEMKLSKINNTKINETTYYTNRLMLLDLTCDHDAETECTKARSSNKTRTSTPKTQIRTSSTSKPQ